MDNTRLITDIWAKSHTVWSDSPDEISNRLGWLDSATRMDEDRHCIAALQQDIQHEGFTRAIVLGMGGSSLAAEVFAHMFQGEDMMQVLDSTHPAALQALAHSLDLTQTLFIVATKSGTTTETLSFFKYFYNRAQAQLGPERAGEHFVAITDPDTSLVTLATACNFRAIYVNDPNIGGRYSALSYFGLVPAALVGVNLRRLLRRAQEVIYDCSHRTAAANPAAQLGAMMGELAKAGKDKLTIIADREVASFADWLEQLVAESTGKAGRGILPVVESIAPPAAYGDDRLFVHLQWSDSNAQDAAVQALIDAGHPVIRSCFRDRYDLGGQFFLWQFATAVAGARLGIHPFNQPNVEAAKQQARQMMSAYMASGNLPVLSPALEANGVKVYGDVEADNPLEALMAFLAQARPGDYISLQAYLQPSAPVERLLHTMQECLRTRTKLATTLGFGPRFLHSSGQLHKGDAGNGLFIQLTDTPSCYEGIPDEAGGSSASVPFSVLLQAQSLGDRQALLNEGRRVLRLDLGENAQTQLEWLVKAAAACQDGP